MLNGILVTVFVFVSLVCLVGLWVQGQRTESAYRAASEKLRYWQDAFKKGERVSDLITQTETPEIVAKLHHAELLYKEANAVLEAVETMLRPTTPWTIVRDTFSPATAKKALAMMERPFECCPGDDAPFEISLGPASHAVFLNVHLALQQSATA